MSADLTRPLRGACRPKKIEFFRSSDRDFPTHFGPRRERQGQDTITHTVTSRSHTALHGKLCHAASGLDGSRGCACYARRRRERTCENRTGTPIAASHRSRRRPPSGHGTGRERGGCGRAPESVAAAAAASDAPLGRLRFVHKKRPRKGCRKNRAP
jgi:hypothetical protein